MVLCAIASFSSFSLLFSDLTRRTQRRERREGCCQSQSSRLLRCCTSTLETQKTAAAARLSLKSQNTEDRIQPKTAISRPLETCQISHLFHVVGVRFQLHIVPQHPVFQDSEYLCQLVLQVAILFICGLHHEIFMPSLRDLCVKKYCSSLLINASFFIKTLHIHRREKASFG